jgi:methyltransferase (TIGR00027 family)
MMYLLCEVIQTENASMTALVSLFARAFHSENNDIKIFDDSMALKILSKKEYDKMCETFAKGISFFAPNFSGSNKETLRFIVDSQLSPSPLGRAAFAEKSLENAVRFGAKQYLILGAGYDTFAYRGAPYKKPLEIFEIDRAAVQSDKQKRLRDAGIEVPENVHFVCADFSQKNLENALSVSGDFSKNKLSFCSLLGLTYYLSKESFENLLAVLSSLLVKGSTLAFDYPDEQSFSADAGERAKKQMILAEGSNEKMHSCYSLSFMEHLLEKYGFLCYEHLTPKEITEQYFSRYNEANPENKMSAFDNVNYCLAVKA